MGEDRRGGKIRELRTAARKDDGVAAACLESLLPPFEEVDEDDEDAVRVAEEKLIRRVVALQLIAEGIREIRFLRILWTPKER